MCSVLLLFSFVCVCVVVSFLYCDFVVFVFVCDECVSVLCVFDVY